MVRTLAFSSRGRWFDHKDMMFVSMYIPERLTARFNSLGWIKLGHQPQSGQSNNEQAPMEMQF